MCLFEDRVPLSNHYLSITLLNGHSAVLGSRYNAAAAGLAVRLQIRRVKNRFAAPTCGGWADCLVSISIGNCKHVAEIQLVHARLMLVRKNMGAHHVYSNFRTAYEVLSMFGTNVLAEIDEPATTESPRD